MLAPGALCVWSLPRLLLVRRWRPQWLRLTLTGGLSPGRWCWSTCRWREVQYCGQNKVAWDDAVGLAGKRDAHIQSWAHALTKTAINTRKDPPCAACKSLCAEIGTGAIGRPGESRGVRRQHQAALQGCEEEPAYLVRTRLYCAFSLAPRAVDMVPVVRYLGVEAAINFFLSLPQLVHC